MIQPDEERRRKRTCRFCEEGVEYIDYKDDRYLRRFLTDRAKILTRRVTGTCAFHQRQLTTAIKRGRHLAMLPFTAEVHR
ncbi:MAG: 30S ribosomal protein S18 [candidate division Zixibacteria bacterium RBG_16_50_21]|nr:MAG: 30S ribosomal protein S18 [candidate division Zixibacteria bacterium RBG_16_50_21]